MASPVSSLDPKKKKQMALETAAKEQYQQGPTLNDSEFNHLMVLIKMTKDRAEIHLLTSLEKRRSADSDQI